MSTTKIFEPYNLNGIQLTNRMVMAPMTRNRSTNPETAATALTALYYKQRASAGLIITEGSFINLDAIGSIHVPAMYTQQHIEGWKLTTAAVHQEGGKIFAQLWHTGAGSHPDFLEGRLPLSASAFNPKMRVFTPEGFKETVASKAMSLEDIKKTIADFKQAGINAFEAGFDGIELHAAAYLLQQFFTKSANTRVDEYGGSIENRARILFDILDELKQVVDISKVGVRLNPSLDGIGEIFADDETIGVYNYIVNRLNDYGLAYIHLMEPWTDVSGNPNAIQEVAKHFRKIYKGTIIINNGFTKEKATKILDDGDADLVAFGVPFIANPDLVARFKTDAPLNQPDQATFYTPGEIGYTDYPTL